MKRQASRGAMHLILDSSGLSICGEGEWAAARYGERGRRGWRKRHLIVHYAEEDGVSLAVGFYCTCNALGRLLGTILSACCVRRCVARRPGPRPARLAA
jgi:hypothetical protein